MSKALAQIDVPTLCEDIFLNMELSLAHYEKQRRRVGTTKLETLKPRLIELANENRMAAADWAVVYQANLFQKIIDLQFIQVLELSIVLRLNSRA